MGALPGTGWFSMHALRFSNPLFVATALAGILLTTMAQARGGHASLAHIAPLAPMVPAVSAPARPTKPTPPSKGSGSSAASAASSIGPETVTPPTLPPSEIGTPMQQVPAIAPLSPQLPEQFSTGGSTASTLALSPGASSSPSESAPSAPGGGGKTLEACMGFWDRATHMTKAEWKAACLRTMDEFPDVMR
jgi:hypothetical protein